MMSFSQKLIQLRKKQGMSQEQLANCLNVTRQSVSKWESGSSIPELTKLISLAKLFHVSLDYLVMENQEDKFYSRENVQVSTDNLKEQLDALSSYVKGYSYTSKTKIAGIPLVSIRLSRHMGTGCTAKGILAIGNAAVGLISIGVVSAGLLSFGTFSLGLLSLGALSLGLVSLGAVSVGILAFGSVAIGVYSVGVAAVGSKIAVGAAALGELAIGKDASGTHILNCGPGLTRDIVKRFIKAEYPHLFRPLLELFSSIGSVLK